MKRVIAKYVSMLCAIALAAGALAGCSAGGSSATEEQQDNRAYMSQVSEVMTELDENLDAFNDAVSQGDVVNMRIQAENAYRSLDRLSSLTVPDDLADVQESYVNGTEKLRDALDEYIALYSEVDAGSLDESTYSDRMAKIQSLYDEGVAALEQGDITAAQKE